MGNSRARIQASTTEEILLNSDSLIELDGGKRKSARMLVDAEPIYYECQGGPKSVAIGSW